MRVVPAQDLSDGLNDVFELQWDQISRDLAAKKRLEVETRGVFRAGGLRYEVARADEASVCRRPAQVSR